MTAEIQKSEETKYSKNTVTRTEYPEAMKYWKNSQNNLKMTVND